MPVFFTKIPHKIGSSQKGKWIEPKGSTARAKLGIPKKAYETPPEYEDSFSLIL